jgi:hypothetical protein
MPKPAAAFLCIALTAFSPSGMNAAAQDFPAIEGVVTRVASSSDFDVNGQHIFCASITKIVDSTVSSGSYLGCPNGPVLLGQGMTVWGDWDKKQHIIATSQLVIAPTPSRDLSGAAVIEESPVAGDTPGTLIVCADGYRIRLDQETSITWTDPLHGFADIKPGNWIEYRGKRGADGLVIAASAVLRPAVFSAEELNDRSNYEYDAAATPTSARQGVFSQTMKGIDPKRFPAYTNAAMEERITDVGEKLIPSYQLALPDTDHAKIDFRFRLVESSVWWDATPLPSGIILVPHELVERMQNDSQLAAVLADSMASILEKQDFRTESAARAVLPEALINAAASARTVGAQLAGMGAGIREDASTKALDQSGRVALDLMHDAGFEIDQAPIAWWLLSRKKPAAYQDMPMPRRAAYLYQVLGQNWNSQVAGKP